MSFKTDRLVALFPDAYAARETDSLLHRLLDALGAELVAGDAAVKDLLKSHWVDFARGGGLDQLGALLGIARRVLPDGTPESDDTFRPLVKSTVSSFVGGGTVEAVKGAVRAALGLPYDLALFQRQLDPRGKPGDALLALIEGLRRIVRIEEFSPKNELVIGAALPAAGGSSTQLDLASTSIEPVPPTIQWSFGPGGGRSLRVIHTETGLGFMSRGSFAVAQGATLKLGGGANGFTASIGATDVQGNFIDIDGSSPPRMPPVPTGTSKWRFSAAAGGEYDVSAFDTSESFDSPSFSVAMGWTRYQPLMFDVIVPYFVDAAVRRIVAGSGYEKRFKVFRGLSLDAIQKVVDGARAAGVRGSVQYQISLPGESRQATPWEDHAVVEAFTGNLAGQWRETQDASDALAIGAFDSAAEDHAAVEHFAIGGVFNVSVFDGSFGFQ